MRGWAGEMSAGRVRRRYGGGDKGEDEMNASSYNAQKYYAMVTSCGGLKRFS